jgi:hypothetical protein
MHNGAAEQGGFSIVKYLDLAAHIDVSNPLQRSDHRRHWDRVTSIQDKGHHEKAAKGLSRSHIFKSSCNGANQILRCKRNAVKDKQENTEAEIESQRSEKENYTHKYCLAEDCKPTKKYKTTEYMARMIKATAKSTTVNAAASMKG